MKNKQIVLHIFLSACIVLIVAGCSKILDKQPITQIVTKTDSTSINATDAENLILGVYTSYKGRKRH